MKKLFVIAIVIATLPSLFTSGAPLATTRAVADIAPSVEVVFVLDTTESMVSLIQGAKSKIWTIAKQMALGRPSPSIRLGLVGYRDRGDEYVTRSYALTNDIDAIYGHLMEFKATGGRDVPESVNQALYEAVTGQSWSKEPGVLRIIFLVGDAPPHMDYADDVKYPETIEMASRSGIIINTIQCGGSPQTTAIWKEIASRAGGAFVQIVQSGGMSAISTPVDSELSRLSRELTRTVVPYGDAARQSEVRTKSAAASRADADRMVFLNVDRADFGAKIVVTGEGELIWDVVNRKVRLEDISEADFPVSMKEMTLQEKRTFVQEQFNRRKELQLQVDELSKERELHVKVEMDKLAASGSGDSFDAKVADIIREQARRLGVEYDVSIPEPTRQ